MRIRGSLRLPKTEGGRAFGLCAAAMLALLAWTPSLWAQERLVLGGGLTNILAHDHRGIIYLEYHSDWEAWGLKPMAGFLTDEDGDTYAYAGLRMEFAISPRLRFIPSFSAGHYKDGPGHPPMGGPLEFHSTFRLDYSLDGGIRTGAAYGHISNANIYESNPGTNSISVYLSLPLGKVR